MPLQQPSIWDILLQLLPYLFGTGGFITLYIAWKTRKSTVKQTEATALESIDTIYDKMSARVDKEIEKYQKIIDKQDSKIGKLETLLNEYISQCKTCVNNKIGKQ